MGGADISTREIARLLNAQAEALGMALLPNAVKAGGFLCVGSVQGEPGDSLKITLRGPKAGGWADYSCSRGTPEGSGDMLKLIMLTVAPPRPGEKEQANAVRWAKGWLGIESMDPEGLERMRRRANAAAAKAELQAAQQAERSWVKAKNFWLGGAPLHGTPGQRYFEGRGIDFAEIGRFPRAMRFIHDAHHAELGRTCPAVLTAGFSLDGQHRVTHATYLHRQADGSWVKLPPVEVVDGESGEVQAVKAAKKIFGKGLGHHFPINRGASGKPLRDMPAGESVHVSEGMEDALTFAMAFPGARVLAAGTLGNIAELVLPPQCGDLVVLAQRDAPGSKAAEAFEKALAAQQAQAKAQGSKRRVLLRWPGEGFKDLNDELLGKEMGR